MFTNDILCTVTTHDRNRYIAYYNGHQKFDSQLLIILKKVMLCLGRLKVIF